MLKRKSRSGPQFEISVEAPGAIHGYKRGDRIKDPTPEQVERAKTSRLLKLIEVGGEAKPEAPAEAEAQEGTETKEGRGET